MTPPTLATARAEAPPRGADRFRWDILEGLANRPRQLPSKYFYDAVGSALFEAICEQPEYYLTRTELAIMETHLASMSAAIGPRARLIEYGAGAGVKTQLLLSAMIDPIDFVPVEISRAALDGCIARLGDSLPRIPVHPLCADFTQAALPLPPPDRPPLRNVVYFPGSTLGNFAPDEAIRLLRAMRQTAGRNGAVLIGLDLQKNPLVLEAAYNDAAGITAAFTLNLLARINRELGGTFDLTRFRHQARYVESEGRIETHLVSLSDQHVSVSGQSFGFQRGEAMLVEYSTKYSAADIRDLCDAAELDVCRYWTDAQKRFAVLLLEPSARARRRLV